MSKVFKSIYKEGDKLKVIDFLEPKDNDNPHHTEPFISIASFMNGEDGKIYACYSLLTPEDARAAADTILEMLKNHNL